jgi:hypothetical protein
MRIFEGFSTNMVFNVKKILNIGKGLTLWQKESLQAE